MKKFLNVAAAHIASGQRPNWIDNQTVVRRYQPIPDMVAELLARTDPGLYGQMLEGFRNDFQPVGGEVQIVERIARIACLMRGCCYLETEILKRDMEAGALPGEAPADALARAFIADFGGPMLIDKISRYQIRLEREFSLCANLMQRCVKNRKLEQARVAASLLKTKPCTSVIQ